MSTCYAVTKAGARCRQEAQPDDVVCLRHDRARDQSTVIRATNRLMSEAAATVEAVVHMRDHGTPDDAVRLQAAKLLLSRQFPETRINEHNVRLDPVLVWDRLSQLVASADAEPTRAGKLRPVGGRVAVEVESRENR